MLIEKDGEVYCAPRELHRAYGPLRAATRGKQDLGLTDLERHTTASRPADERVGRDLIITTEHIDRDNDIVRRDGLDISSYAANPFLFLQHAMPGLPGFPVIGGNAVLEKMTTDDGVPGWLAKSWTWGDTQLGRDIQSLWEDNILRTASIGFQPIEWRPIDAQGVAIDVSDSRAMKAHTGMEFTRSVLHEFSIVALPANSHARKKMADVFKSLKSARTFFDLGQPRRAASCGKTSGTQLPVVPPNQERGFDPETEELSPESTVIDWASKFLDAPVRDLAIHREHIPGARLGSFLYSFEETLKDDGWTIAATRNIVWSASESPPVRRVVQLDSSRTKTFVVDGTSFYRRDDAGMVVTRTTSYGGSVRISTIFHPGHGRRGIGVHGQDVESDSGRE